MTRAWPYFFLGSLWETECSARRARKGGGRATDFYGPYVTQRGEGGKGKIFFMHSDDPPKRSAWQEGNSGRKRKRSGFANIPNLVLTSLSTPNLIPQKKTSFTEAAWTLENSIQLFFVSSGNNLGTLQWNSVSRSGPSWKLQKHFYFIPGPNRAVKNTKVFSRPIKKSKWIMRVEMRFRFSNKKTSDSSRRP